MLRENYQIIGPAGDLLLSHYMESSRLCSTHQNCFHRGIVLKGESDSCASLSMGHAAFFHGVEGSEVIFGGLDLVACLVIWH